MKKQIAIIALSAVLALGVFGCAGQSGDQPAEGQADDAATQEATDDYVMQMPLTGIMCEAPISIAYINGYFDEEGLNYETFRTDGVDNYDTMLSGKNDVVYGLLPTMVQRMANGFEMDVIMGVHHGCINMVASKDSGVTSIADLKGKKIGVPGLGSDPDIMLRRVLKANGISTDVNNMEVQIMAFQDTDLQAALESGQIDAMISWDPFATQVAETTDAVMIYQQAEDEFTRDEDCCLVGLRPGFVEEHPEAAVKYLNAIDRACDFIAENPEEAAQLIIDNDLCGCDDVELVAQLLDSYRYDAQIDDGRESFQNCAQDLIDLEIIDPGMSAEEFTDSAFYEVEGFTTD